MTAPKRELCNGYAPIGFWLNPQIMFDSIFGGPILMEIWDLTAEVGRGGGSSCLGCDAVRLVDWFVLSSAD